MHEEIQIPKYRYTKRQFNLFWIVVVSILEFVFSRALHEVVGERSMGGEGVSTRHAGAHRSENGGMSSEKLVRIQLAKCPRFLGQRSSSPG